MEHARIFRTYPLGVMQYDRFGVFNHQLLDFFFELPHAQVLHNSQCPGDSHLGYHLIDMNGFSTLKEQYLFLQFVQGLPKGFFFTRRTDYKRGIEDLCQSKTFGVLATNADLGNIEPAVTPLSLIHISEPTRRTPISYAVF